MNFEQLKADMEAGTQGDWVTGPHSETQVSGTTSVCSTGGWYDSKIDPETQYKMQLANARRIARIPQLERIALAAEALVNLWQDISRFKNEDRKAALDALRAYREATK